MNLFTILLLVLPFASLAEFNSVEIEDCGTAVTDAATCETFCGDEGQHFFTGKTGNGQVLQGVSCSCGGDEFSNPENVTKRCEATFEPVVVDCYSDEVRVEDEDTCNTWCGDVEGSFLRTTGADVTKGGNRPLTGVACTCGVPIIRSCDGIYTLVEQDCSSTDTDFIVSDKASCDAWCGEEGDYITGFEGSGNVGVRCECRPHGVVTAMCGTAGTAAASNGWMQRGLTLMVTSIPAAMLIIVWR